MLTRTHGFSMTLGRSFTPAHHATGGPSEGLQQIEDRIQNAVLAKLNPPMDLEVPDRLCALEGQVQQLLTKQQNLEVQFQEHSGPTFSTEFMRCRAKLLPKPNSCTATWKTKIKPCNLFSNSRCSRLEACLPSVRGMKVWNDKLAVGSLAQC